MTKKKKRITVMIFSITIFIIACLIFLAALYYKQYLPVYLIDSIAIILALLLLSLPFIFKKYKKRKLSISIILITLSISLISSGYIIYNQNERLANEGEYIGIDVSKWNGNINYQIVKQEVDFVIIRCGYTSLNDGVTTKQDALFYQNVQACIDHQIPYGIYYYSLAQNETQALNEANFVSSLIQNLNPQLGIFIDLEDEQYQQHLSNDQLTNIATTFLDNIQLPVYKGIYANHYWWQNKLTDERLNNYIKWKARYNDNRILDSGFQILQYSETGKIRGIDSNVDLNIMNEIYW